ncbi:hypothetical protein KIPB_014737, partial [Kipferlia bialata]
SASPETVLAQLNALAADSEITGLLLVADSFVVHCLEGTHSKVMTYLTQLQPICSRWPGLPSTHPLLFLEAR